MKELHLVDSNILIYAVQPEFGFLEDWLKPESALLSMISFPEVLGFTGLGEADENTFERWFATLPVVGVSATILRRSAILRRQRRMKLGDSIIAATALVENVDLVTRNEGDFRHISGLRVINPFRSEDFPVS